MTVTGGFVVQLVKYKLEMQSFRLPVVAQCLAAFSYGGSADERFDDWKSGR